MPVNPYQKYKEQSVMTMTQGEMLLRLYDEVIKQINVALIMIEEKDHRKRNEALTKAQKILYHLQSTLNHKYEIADNLWALYDYFIRLMVKANIKANPEPLKEILPMVSELRDAFAQAERLTRAQ